MGNGRDCTCGSGAHPRHCDKHPLNYGRHVAELQTEQAREEAASALGDIGERAHRAAQAAADEAYWRVYAEELRRAGVERANASVEEASR